MSWVKLDDDFPHHPKVVGLSLEARWAYIESLCYAAKYETDGVIPGAIAPNGPVREELISSGLWENLETSVHIHDFLAYNPSKAERLAKRIAASNAAAKRWALGEGVGSGSGFDEFWSVYPRKVGKPRARIAFERCLRDTSAEDIIAGAKRYAEDPNRSDEFTAHPTTWLNREGWNDDPLPSRGRKPEDDERELERRRKVAEAKRIAEEGRRATHAR